MVVNDFDVVGIATAPAKADTPLIIDPNTVLTLSIAFQLLEVIARRRPQVVQLNRRIHMAQLPEHDAPKVGRETTHWFARPEALRIAIGKVANHAGIVTRAVTIRKSPGPAQLTNGVVLGRF